MSVFYMRTRPPRSLMVMALFAGISLIQVPAHAQEGSGRPVTVRDLFRKMGAPAAKSKQLKLRLEATITGKDLGAMPESMEIAVTYDKGENLVRVVNDSVFPDGMKKRTTTISDQKRGVSWTERKRLEDASVKEPKLEVRRLEPTQTLPNPWTLPVKLAFPGLFTDALHGHEALAREYSRSIRLNREPDEAGLMWFELRPSATSGTAMRNEFNAGLGVKAGFAADGGWLQELEVRYVKPKAVMKLRVVERSLELSEADQAAFEVPEKVMAAVKKMPKQKPGAVRRPPANGSVPLEDLDARRFEPRNRGK